MKKTILFVLIFALCTVVEIANAANTNQVPIADAGLPRYAAIEPVVLDGTGSYDPDESGLLSYTWQQMSGPSVTITAADTAAPTISDFVQTDKIQECKFELLVSDGELTSLPDIVKVIIVPDFGDRTFQLENPPFDPNKPTVIYFGGGDAASGDVIIGLNGNPGHYWNNDAWSSRANVISFPSGYYPDGRHYEPWATYYSYGDLLIVYLSNVAPNYQQPIQVLGFSLGGNPTLDFGIRLNSYSDVRYAVHHVTAIDAATRAQPEFGGSWDMFGQTVELFLNSSVDGKPCWLDFYYGTIGWPYEPFPRTDFLRARSGLGHGPVRNWYRDSITSSDMNKFNGGIVAGAYWSVVGPGKNLHLARSDAYYFEWDGGVQSGSMNFYDETQFPGRLPEPVTLIGPEDGSFVDANGAILSCEISQNSIGYQLLFGRDLYHMIYLFSDTPTPPNEQITSFPFEKTWWTVKAYDQYGSTIYADPNSIIAENVIPQTIENITTTRQYSSIQQAINDALDDQEIVISPGIYQYLENINFKGKKLTIRSTNPNDPNVVAATVIKGADHRPVVTFSCGQGAGSEIAGLTITGENTGFSCRDATPTIRNCTIISNGPIAVEFWDGYEPTIINCDIQGQISQVDDPRVIVNWKLDETEGMFAADSVGDNDAIVLGGIEWHPAGGQIDGALKLDGVSGYAIAGEVLNPADGPFSTIAWIKCDAPGKVVLSQQFASNWLATDADGKLMTELKSSDPLAEPLVSETVITDGQWHRIGLVWDGSHRKLYVDRVIEAEDTQVSLESSESGLNIGVGEMTQLGTYFSGLIDDIRIYNRVVSP